LIVDECSNVPANEAANHQASDAPDAFSDFRAIGESFGIPLEDICATLLVILDRKFPPPAFEFSVN
jgi:hypothetical protein